MVYVRQSMGLAAAMMCAAMWAAGPIAWAGPTDEAMAPVKAQLEKKIRLQLLQVPLERALDFLQQESGLTFVVDRAALQTQLKSAIELNVESITIGEALDLMLMQVREMSRGDVDWDVRKGRVYISTPAKVIAPYLETKVYDVRTLTQPIVNFRTPYRVGLLGVTGGYAGGDSDSLFEDADDAPTPDIAGLDADTLRNLIELSVRVGPHQGNWSIDGVSITYANGLLVVVNTPEAQAATADLLDKYQKAYGKMISVNARFVLMKTATLDAFVRETTGGALVLDAKQRAALLKRAGEANEAVRIVGMARTVAFNSQRVNVVAGNEASLVSDLDPLVGTSALAFDPYVSTMVNSTVLDITPTASFDNTSVSMVIRGGVALGDSIRSRDDVAPGAVATSAEPPSAEDGAARPPRLPGREGAVGIDSAIVELPDQDSVQFNTSAKIPSGGAVLLSGFSAQFKHLQAEGFEVVLMIDATVSP